MKQFFLVLLFCLPFSVLAQTINVNGAWEREDDKMRTLTLLEDGNIRMETEEGETYIYYKVGENLYQMNWTTSLYGTHYRWTMTVVNEDTIDNVYEVRENGYTHNRIYKRVFL